MPAGGEQWEAHGGLRASEQPYRAFFDAIDEGFCIIESVPVEPGQPSDFRYVAANPAFEAQTGVGGVVGKTIREAFPGEPQTWFDTYDRIVETGEPIRFERDLVTQGRVLELYAFRLGDQTQRRVGVLFRDVTSRVRAEEALRDANRRKDEFLAMLAHELRNPLAPMRNAVSLVDAQLKHGEDPSRPLEILSRQTTRLARLVDDLMDVSRITRGTIELRLEAVDMAELAGRAIESVRAQAEAKRHDVNVSLPGRGVTVRGDPIRLEQIIGNLVSNAIKYTDPGGSIFVSVEADEETVEIRVRDTGIGIEAPFLGLVFDVFEQADTSLDRSQGGLGIGLTVARTLVELHGGTIEAHSEGSGMGCEFVVRLPHATDVAPSAEPSLHVDDPSAARSLDQPRRVLVVDDNADHAEVIAELIGDLGHEAHVAHDGPTALTRAAEIRPDLVLLDIGLPAVNGYDVARSLRQGAPDHVPMLVALTGYGQPEDRERSADAGFDEHIVKPIELDDLKRVLSASQRRASRAEQS